MEVTPSRRVQKKGHFIKNRNAELVTGALLFIVGAILLWDAYNGRGKNAPWPLGGIFPF